MLNNLKQIETPTEMHKIPLWISTNRAYNFSFIKSHIASLCDRCCPLYVNTQNAINIFFCSLALRLARGWPLTLVLNSLHALKINPSNNRVRECAEFAVQFLGELKNLINVNCNYELKVYILYNVTKVHLLVEP